MPRNSILSRLNDTSKMGAVNTSGYTLMYLDTDSLVPSKDNFYGIREIEALADNMLTAGNIEPVIVGKVGDEFRIISGHRRWHAVVMNKERGYSEFDKIACMVKEMSYNMFMFTLISANAFTRRLNDYELLHQAELLREYTTRLCEEEGMDVHGKMRDYLASTLGVSNTKMAQIDCINNNLSDEGKKALESGQMNFSKAYQVSRLPEEKQHDVIADKKLLSNDVKDIASKLTEETPASQKESRSEEAGRPVRKTEAYEINVKWNGIDFNIILGKYGNRHFIALPDQEVCCKDFDPWNVSEIIKKLSNIIKPDEAAVEIAGEIYRCYHSKLMKKLMKEG